MKTESKGLIAKISGSLSKLPSKSIKSISEEEKEGFRNSQKLAYECVTEVEKLLKEGMTEKQAAALLWEFLQDHGVKTFLHRPFAWFGEHSKFEGYRFYTQYRPGNKVLKADDVYILDVSPILNGYIGDIGYTNSMTLNVPMNAAKDYLMEIRNKLPGEFKSKKSVSQIWKELDADIKSRGYENAHAKYPFSVLGHRVYKVPFYNTSFPIIPISFASWFSFQAQFAFLTHGILPELMTPDHLGSKVGAWAIEPHIGGNGFGAKFEEIMIVEEDNAYWLQNDVPHVLDYNKRKGVSK